MALGDGILRMIERQVNELLRLKENEIVLRCPIHGVIPEEKVTTIKSCGLCMEEQGVSAGDATLLIRG
jgi:hypothetical protein